MKVRKFFVTGLLVVMLIMALAAEASAADTGTDSIGDPLPAGAVLRLGTSRFHAPSSVYDLAISPDEKTVVTIGNCLIAWDAASGQECWRVGGRGDLQTSYGVHGAAFTADGRLYTPGPPATVTGWIGDSGRQGTIFVWHPMPSAEGPLKAFRSVDVTPDGQRLALGNGAGIIVCNLDGESLFRIENHPDNPLGFDSSDRLKFGGDYSLAQFSPDGKILAVVTSDTPEAIRLCDGADGHELRRIALKARLVRMAFSSDGKKIAATERDAAVRLYDVDTGKPIWSHVVELHDPFENYTSGVAYSPDGRIVAAGATDNRIYLLDAETGNELVALSSHTERPWALAFTADSKTLYSSGWDGAVRRWDVAARKELALPKGVRATGIVAASPNGKMLAYEDDAGVIRITSAADGAEMQTIAVSGMHYSQLAFSPDSRQLAGGGGGGDQVRIVVWDLSTGKSLHNWQWPKGKDPHSTVESLQFSSDGNRLAAAVFRQSTASLFDLAGERVFELPHKEVYGLSFAPDSRTLATAGWDSVVRFWDSGSGNLLKELDVKLGRQNEGDLRMYTVCNAPQGDLIATAHLDGTVRIWSASDLSFKIKFQTPGRFSWGAMSFSPDGLWLATGGANGNVVLWDALSGNALWANGRHEGTVYTVGFGRDNKTLVSGGGADGCCYVWKLWPADLKPPDDMAAEWDRLASNAPVAAYRAVCTLASVPERSLPFLTEKLRSIHSVIDLDRASAGLSVDELSSQKRMKKLLVEKHTGVEETITVRRAIAVLAEIGTPEAVALLKEIAQRDPDGEMSQLAGTTLRRFDRDSGAK